MPIGEKEKKVAYPALQEVMSQQDTQKHKGEMGKLLEETPQRRDPKTWGSLSIQEDWLIKSPRQPRLGQVLEQEATLEEIWC